MSSPRLEHTATLLLDGRVLVAGGRTTSPPAILKTAEIFDPEATDPVTGRKGTWTRIGDMNYSRRSHTATLLENGQVLVAGGHGDEPELTREGGLLSSAEIFDPNAADPATGRMGAWKMTGAMGAGLQTADLDVPSRARSGHSAVRLPDGKVLVTGGRQGGNQISECVAGVNCYAEVYDPLATDPATGRQGTWLPTGSMLETRIGPHSSTLLPSGPTSICGPNCGKVLVVGGFPAVAELFDPSVTDPSTGYMGVWTLTGRPTDQHAGVKHNANLLPDGKVLAGPFSFLTGTLFMHTHEIYDPASGAWTPAAFDGYFLGGSSTLLPGGKVLATNSNRDHSTVWDPVTVLEAQTAGSRLVAGGQMTTPRFDHQAVLLRNGDVLVVGGDTRVSPLVEPVEGAPTDTAEIYTALPLLSVSDVTVAEGTSAPVTAQFEVSLSRPAATAFSVFFETADGTATAGGAAPDYLGINSGTVLFEAGQRSRTISVEILPDQDRAELDEDFYLDMSTDSDSVFIWDGRGRGTVADNDPSSSVLAVDDVMVPEGAEGQTSQAVFTISLSRPSAAPVSVSAATRSATAGGSATNDYFDTSLRLAFSPNETRKTFTVPIVGDYILEADEAFVVHLFDAVGAGVAKSAGEGVIENDDMSPLISISDAVVTEGDEGKTQAVLRVSLSRPTHRPVTTGWLVSDGTARAPGDYSASGATGTVTFAPYESGPKPIIVTIAGDRNPEPDETFFVMLSGTTNAATADRVGRGTVRNDDRTPF